MNNNFMDFEMVEDNIPKEKNMYRCSNCNRYYILKDKIDNCIFCNGKLDGEAIVSNVNPTRMISFSKDISVAIKDYKKRVMFNPLVPLIFKSKKTIQNMKKAYVVTNLSDVNISGSCKILAKDEASSNKYEILNTSNLDFNKVFSNNTLISDDIFYSVGDYNFNNLSEVNNEFLNDIIIVGNNNEKENQSKLNNDLMKSSLSMIRSNVKHDLKKINSNDLVVNYKSTLSILLPVFILNVKYNNKDYIYLMNGDTGSSNMNITDGKLELVITSIIIFGIIFLVAYLIAYFL